MVRRAGRTAQRLEPAGCLADNIGDVWIIRRLRAGVMAAVAFDAVTMGAGHSGMALFTCETELTASLIDTRWPSGYS